MRLVLTLCGVILHSVFVFHPAAALRGRKPPRAAVVENYRGKEDVAGGMRRNSRQSESETVSGGRRTEPGELLCTVGPDRRRIGLEALIRLAVSAFALALAAYQGTDPPLLPTAAALLIFVLWPLRHWSDGMELRRGGVVYRGEFYPVGGRAAWVGTRLGFLPSTFLDLGGGRRRIDVSFMRDAEKLFARTYANIV